MSPTDRLRLAHRVAGIAISEMVCADNALDSVLAARLLAGAALASVRGLAGSEAAAEAGYRLADAMVDTE